MPKTLSRKFGRMAVMLTLVAALISVTSAPANAVVAPADGYGFANGSAWVTNSAADSNRELDAVAKTGASWIRLPIDWGTVEMTKGQYNWGYVDNLVNSAQSHGLRILGWIGYTPIWARTEGAQLLFPSSPPRDMAAWGRFVTAAAQRYAGRINSWEIWNEPNLPLFMGFISNKPQHYVDIIKTAYPAIKSVAPGATVVAAGLSPLDGQDSPPGFLQQLYDAGIGGYFDAAAAHPYVFPGGLAADSQNGWSDVGRMHDIMAAHGDGGKKIWLTEMGAATSVGDGQGVSQQEQAKEITDVLAAAAATPYVGPAFIYSVRDTNSANTGDRESCFGALLTTDWQPKLSASVLAR
ncbi:hypothetical protein ABIA30_005231 [Mycobacterium sp. MAA66]|uniref:endo-1,4-beta-xylanase n=1 Tax=Mycobacterium sp. MAA66 TaxID=3156297 RepID=UPI0035157211